MFIATSVITTSDRYDRQPSVCRRNIGADRVTAASSPSGYLALMQRRQDPVQAPRLRLESPSLEPVALREQRVGDRSHFDEGRGACERETGVTERRAGSCLRTAATVSEEPPQSSACTSVGRRP